MWSLSVYQLELPESTLGTNGGERFGDMERGKGSIRIISSNADDFAAIGRYATRCHFVLTQYPMPNASLRKTSL